MSVTLTEYPLIGTLPASVEFYQNMATAGAATPSTIAKASIPASAGGFGEWQKTGDYYEPFSGYQDYAAIRINEIVTELRIVAKAKYNTGWMTVWEKINNVWTQIAELTCNYNMVKAIPLVAGVYANWYLPQPLTKYDANSDLDKYANPGPDNFLNIEFYISWDVNNTQRDIRICGMGGSELPSTDCRWITPVPIFSVDVMSGVYDPVTRQPFHNIFSMYSILYDTMVPILRLNNDRISQWSGASGASPYGSEYSNAYNMEPVGQSPQVAMKSNGNMVVLAIHSVQCLTDEGEWGSQNHHPYLSLSEYDKYGVFRKRIDITKFLTDNSITSVNGGAFWRVSGVAVDALDNVYLNLVYGVDSGGNTNGKIVKFDSSWNLSVITSLPARQGYDVAWSSIWFDSPYIKVNSGCGQILYLNTSLNIVQTKNITDGNFIGHIGGQPVTFVYSEWARVPGGNMFTCLGLAHKIYLVDENYNVVACVGYPGVGTVGSIWGTGGISSDSQGRFYNADQNTVQVWKPGCQKPFPQNGLDTDVEYIVGNEDGSSNVWLGGYYDVKADQDSRIVAGTKDGFKVLVDAGTISGLIKGHTAKTTTQLAKYYGYGNHKPGSWITGRAFGGFPSRAMLMSPECVLLGANNDAYVLEGKGRIIKLDVTTPSTPKTVNTVTETFVPSNGQTAITLTNFFEPQSLYVTVNGVEKVLQKILDAGNGDYHTNPYNYGEDEGASDTKGRNDPAISNEQVITKDLVFNVAFNGSQTVVVSYVRKDTVNEAIFAHSGVSKSNMAKLYAHRMDIDTTNSLIYVLFPYYGAWTDGLLGNVDMTMSYVGMVKSYSTSTLQEVGSWLLTGYGGYKTDIKVITRDAVKYIWVADFDNSQILEFTTAGVYQATYAITAGKPSRFSKHVDGSGNYLVLCEGNIVALNNAGAVQYTITDLDKLKYAKFLDVMSDGDIIVGTWNMLLIYDASTHLAKEYIDEVTTMDWEHPRQVDLMRDSSDRLYHLMNYRVGTRYYPEIADASMSYLQVKTVN